MIKRYGPVEEFVLERWVPAKAYGTRERWYASAAIGGTMVCSNVGNDKLEHLPTQGEYPSRGDYEYTGYGFAPDQLSEASVINLVQAILHDHEALPTDPARRIAMRSAIAREANEVAERIAEQRDLEMLDDLMPAFGLNPRVGYGPKRKPSVNRVAEKLGIRNHTGVS